LYLALLAAKIGYSHQVIVPTNTYIASWSAITQVGAMPAPVEPAEGTYTIDMIGEGMLPNTVKAIMPVHLYGIPTNMTLIEQFAKRRALWVISDCAQAHGAEWDGKNVGAYEWINCFSFYPGKNLGAFGDAGAITTNKAHVASEIKRLRNHGSAKKYYHEDFGVNARLDPLQAAFLRVKLKYLDEMNEKRKMIAAYYYTCLENVPDIILPIQPIESKAVWHQFVIRHPQRDTLKEWLEINDVPTMMHYPEPPHLSGAYKYLNIPKGTFPIAEEYASTLLSLPIDPFLTDAEVEQVVKGVRSFE
jgi:dTDP-4-amino-4,6-dideoxygalactose transaminase